MENFLNQHQRMIENVVNKPSSIHFTKIPNQVSQLMKFTSLNKAEILWTAPESYLRFIQQVGFFNLNWYSIYLEQFKNIVLLNELQMGSISEIIYLPSGIDFGNGEVSADHLIPFAADPDGEWAFCFDVSSNKTDYPIYYHHQDTPRVRIKSNQKWCLSTSQEPDFKNFDAWLEWLLKSLELQKDPQCLGRPYYDTSESFRI